MKIQILLILLFIAVFFLSCNDGTGEKEPPVNVIFLVADGFSPMSWPIVRAAMAELGGITNLDRIVHTARYTTYANDSWITDSASSMTAMMTGHKTNNGVINQDSTAIYKQQHGNSLINLRTYAASKGMATGIVTTSSIYHATPAGCYASHHSRRENSDIARQLLENEYPPDIIFGGGRKYMTPESITDMESGKSGGRKDGRNLIEELQAQDYKYIEDIQTFNEMNPSGGNKVLGLFEFNHMRYEIDRKNDILGEPGLWEMVDKSLTALKDSPEGFFLVIESAKIDHAAHSHAVDTLIYECIAFDKTVGVILDFIEDNPNTFLLIASDHATATPAGVGVGIGSDSVSTDNIPGVYDDLDRDGFPDQFDVEIPVAVGWASNPVSIKKEIKPGKSLGSHTADDCMAYGAGCGSANVNGFLDNTDLYNILKFYLPDDNTDGVFINLTSNSAVEKRAASSTAVFTAVLEAGDDYKLEIQNMNGFTFFSQSGIAKNNRQFDIIWEAESKEVELPGLYQYYWEVNGAILKKHTFIVR